MFTNTLISNLRAWHNRGLVSRELSAMSDRQLADIGITRSDISTPWSAAVWCATAATRRAPNRA